jgi:hypothetical protein
MLWLSNSSFQIMWESILCFMFFCWNLTMHLPFQGKFMIPLHLLKSMVNMNMKWRTFLYSKIFNCQLQYFCSLAWVWCEQMHLGTNLELIKCHGKGAWISSMISEQAQIHSLWNLSLEGKWCHECQCHGIQLFQCSSMTCNKLICNF